MIHSTIFKRITALVAAAYTLGSTFSIIAQAQEYAAEIPVDFSGKGLTASEACEFFRVKLSTEEMPLNVVVAPEAEDIVLPEMRLKNITFTAFADFINGIGNEMEVTRKRKFGIDQKGEVWYFWAEPSAEDSLGKETIVESLPKDADATLGLIEAALGSEGLRPMPEIKLHEPTNTLIARGSRVDLRLISLIVDQAKRPEVSSALKKKDAAIEQLQKDLANVNEQWQSKLRIADRERQIELESQSDRINQLQKQLALSNAERQKYQELVTTLETKLAAAGNRE